MEGKTELINGSLYARMLRGGAAELRRHREEINGLNVFPIPDGDTGDNMLATVTGGTVDVCGDEPLGEVSKRVADGMLLSARGNSGVILSQFFAGLGKGFSGLESVVASELSVAFGMGVAEAYGAVMTPTEGTVLTVMRESAEYAAGREARTAEEFFSAFLDEAERSLERTPELLPVLRRAGVVDSGAAGFIYIIKGMLNAFKDGDSAQPLEDIEDIKDEATLVGEGDVGAFTEDSVLEYGYCTELLVRLQNKNRGKEVFSEVAAQEFLCSVGDSLVTVLNGSLLKIHIHTFEPHRVLEYCQRYGEFLKVKIENMTLQHSGISEGQTLNTGEHAAVERKRFGIVAVASGEGVARTFSELGADEVVDGGQSANPSAEELLSAIRRVNADTVFVLPNNGNVILTAKQAAALCEDCDVRVVESGNVGEGYAALSSYTAVSEDADEVYSELCDGMAGVQTVLVSRCVRDADFGEDGKVRKGEYIAFSGKRLLGVSTGRIDALLGALNKVDANEYEVCVLLCGRESESAETDAFVSAFKRRYPAKEIYAVDGGQAVYDYIAVFE